MPSLKCSAPRKERRIPEDVVSDRRSARNFFFTEETFNSVQIERDGQEETIDALSLGKIEPVITRIVEILDGAYPLILDGAYPLILDDPFV